MTCRNWAPLGWGCIHQPKGSVPLHLCIPLQDTPRHTFLPEGGSSTHRTSNSILPFLKERERGKKIILWDRFQTLTSVLMSEPLGVRKMSSKLKQTGDWRYDECLQGKVKAIDCSVFSTRLSVWTLRIWGQLCVMVKDLSKIRSLVGCFRNPRGQGVTCGRPLPSILKESPGIHLQYWEGTIMKSLLLLPRQMWFPWGSRTPFAR